MSKTMIIAGKDADNCSDFCEVAVSCSRSVVSHGKQEGSSVLCVEWNKASALGARTFVLKAENKFVVIDEAVFFFDCDFFAKQFSTFSMQTIPQAADEMLLGYHYLCQEVLGRYEKKFDQNAKTLVFLLKTPREKLANFVSVYSSAFEQFATCIATAYKDRPFVNVLMVRLDSSNELYNNEAELSRWLCGYLDARSFPKQSVQWIKAGAKSGGLWNRSF